MVLATVTYFVAGKLGLQLAFDNPSVSPVWAPTGLALAFAILWGPRYWPAVFIGAFLVNVTTTGLTWTSLLIAGGNTLENVIAYHLIRRFTDPIKIFDRTDSVLMFVLSVAIATAFAATVGVITLLVSGLAAGHASVLWLTWWLGDLGGALTLTPLLVLYSRPSRMTWTLIKRIEYCCMLGFLGIAGIVFFRNTFPVSYFYLLPVLWPALRFTRRETMTVTFLLSGITLLGTLNHAGPFAVNGPNMSLLLLQGFMIEAAFIGLVLSSAMAERRMSESALEESVRRRTQELQIAREKDRANYQRLRSTILSLPLAALITDESANLLELNEAYCTTFNIGCSADEARTLSPEELTRRFLKNLTVSDTHMKNVLEAMRKREPIFGQELHLKDGRIIVRDMLPIRDKTMVHGTLFLYRDVTKERRIDAAKSEFMSLASHQLRTPLTAIRWSLSRLQKGDDSDGDTQEKILTDVTRAAGSMADTIDAMLKISRLEANNAHLDIGTEKLKELLMRKKTLLGSDIEARHQSFLIECPDDLSIKTDITFLKEILRNLLQNAVKYTPDNGKISVRAKADGDGIVIEVQDNGYGIPRHQQDKVFQKFFRGDNVLNRDTNGSGLGLYLVSLLMKTLQGTIEMTSEEGKGTTFTLRLPNLKA